jgi:hypothetical protein
MREAGKKQVMLGLGIAAVGLVLTVATYSAASGGGSYFVFWGAIIFGLIRAGHGAAMMRKASAVAPSTSSVATTTPPAPAAVNPATPTQIEPISTQLPAPPPASSMWD